MQTKAYYKYAQDVIEGNVVCGRYIKLAAERFFDFMENDRYEFREEKVDYVIKFFSIDVYKRQEWEYEIDDFQNE